MDYILESLKKSLNEIIAICNVAINEWANQTTGIIDDIQANDLPNNKEIYFNQIRNIVLPESIEILDYIENGKIANCKKYKYNSVWYVTDSWNFKSILGNKILNVSKLLKSI